MRFETSPKRRLAIFSVVLMALALAGCMRTPEEKSAAFVQAGKRLLEKKDPARAILQFQNARQATPRNAEVYYQLGLAYLAASDSRQGLVALRKALELNPKHAAAQLRLAQIMTAVDDAEVLKDAQQRLKGLLEDAPQNPDALHALALTEFKLGDTGTAMEHLQRAAAAAPRELSIAITMAQAKLQQKDPRGAEEVLKKVSDGSPRSAEAHGVLADFYISQGKMPEAETQVRQALTIDPKNGPALMTLARLQLTAGRKEEAEQNFKKLAKFNGYESIYAIFLEQEGRREESLREFERVAKANSADRQARTNLVAAYQKANRLADAKRVLGDVLGKNPNDLDALLQRGELYIGSGEYSLAEADLNKVVKLKPASPEIRYVVGKLNQARGKPLIYRQDLAEALSLNPYLLPVRLEAAQELISSNNAKAALNLLDQAPESQKSSTALLVQRNWAYWAMGNGPEMRKGIDLGLSRERSAELLLQDGMWKLGAGQPAAARTSLEAALNLNPADIRGLAALRQSYVTQKDTLTALQKIKEYAARQPRSAPVQEFLGTLLMVQGNRTEARKAFEAAKAADPVSQQHDLSLVQVDVVEGKLDDGRKRLTAMIDGGNNRPTVRLWLGNLELAKGNQAAAIEQFRKVIEIEPDNAQALNNLAYLLAERDHQGEQALKYAQRAVEIAPDQAAYYDTLGWILYQKGLYSPAIKYLERASSEQGNVAWKYHLSMAYAKGGDSKRGRATLEAALKLNPNLPEAAAAKQVIGNSQ